MGCTNSTPNVDPGVQMDGASSGDIKVDGTVEQKQEDLARHESQKPPASDKDGMEKWRKKKVQLQSELQILQDKPHLPAPSQSWANQSSCYSLTIDEISSDAEPSWMQKGDERMYTCNQMLDVLTYCKKKKNISEVLDTILDEPLICETLSSFVAEAFYFPPHIFETSFHGNGWICLMPQLQKGNNLVAVRSPTGIQVEWTFSSSLRFELTCEWDVKRQNFKCYYTFYRTRKKPNGTMEHKASEHIRVKAFTQEQPFGGVMAMEVKLTHMDAPIIKIFFDGELFQRFQLPIHRKEFVMYKLNPEQFQRCSDVNFYLGAKIRHITSFSYA